MTVILCDASNPGKGRGGLYVCPYNESVSGYRHGYRTPKGVRWTRDAGHPADPACPECHAANPPGSTP